MFGGPAVFPGKVTLQRTYSSLPSHNFVYYSINVLAIDGWQSSDTFSVVFDGTVISTWTPATYMSTYGSASVCGGSSNDLIMTIVGKKSHLSGSLTLGIVFDIQSQATTGASFVIYNAVFSFPSGTITDTDSSNVCFLGGCLIGSTVVTPNQYLDSSSTPQACDAGCSRCFGSGPAKCHKCAYGSTSFDGTSCISCPSNCLQCSSSTVCNRCAVGYVLDSTGTCQLSCSTPTDIQMGNNLGTKVCIAPPCYSPQYILWDYTCGSSCDNPPYTQISSGSLLYCGYPCSYLQYLYEDGSCAYTCEFPYVKRTEPGTKYCDLPCSATEYVYEDGSCEADCPYYMISTVVTGNIRMCISPTVDMTEEVSKMLKASEIGEKMSSVTTKITSFISPSNPTAVTAGAMIKMLTYLRYLNITRSLKLESYFANVYVGFDDLLPQLNFANELENEFENKRLSYMFRKYDVESDFLANYFNDATYLLGYFCAALMMLGLRWMAKMLRNVPYLRSFLKNGRIIVQNFFLGQFYESYGEIIFYSGLAFRFIKLSGGNTTLSFLAAISYTIFGCLLIFGHFYILWRYKKIQKKPRLQVANFEKSTVVKQKEKSPLDEFKEEYEAWQIFYEDFKDASALQIDYLLIVLIRTVIFNLILVLLFDYPFMQIIMIVCVNVFMIIYILVKRPMISHVALFQELIYELILLTANISFLILAILDRKQVGFSYSVNRISQGVIILGVICRFLPTLFLGMTGMETLWRWHKAIQKSNNVTEITKIPSMPNIVVHLEDENNTLSLPAVIESSNPVDEEDNDDAISGVTKAEMTTHSSQAGLFDWSKFETSLNVSSDHLLTTKNDDELKEAKSAKKSSKMVPVHLLMPEINERVKKRTVFDTRKPSHMFDHFELETEKTKISEMIESKVTLDKKKKEEEEKRDDRDSKKEKLDIVKDEKKVEVSRKQSSATEGLDDDDDERLAKRVLKD